MRVCPALLLFLGLLFCQSAFIRAQTVHTASVGETIGVNCLITRFGLKDKKTFCKNNCNKEDDILVATSDREACKGQFCITWNGSFNVYVSITNVTRSDAGQYQCVMEGNSPQTFRIEVTNTQTIYPEHTLGPTTTSASVKSSRPTLTSSEPITIMFWPAILLILLILVAVVLIIASVLIYYRKKKSRNDNRTTRNSEVGLYENIPAGASEPADSTYQTLSADTRDNHIYSSLNTQPPSH